MLSCVPMQLAFLAADFEYNRYMKNIIFMVCAVVLTGGCAGVTSLTAEKVALFKDESVIPDRCEKLGEVTARVCANTTPCPAEVMKKNIREQAFIEYGADVVWLSNTTLSGTEVVGYGIAYKCNE